MPKVNYHPMGENSPNPVTCPRLIWANPGVNDMTTVFSVPCQYSAEKMAFFLKVNAMIPFSTK
jgi:hypothetical protein